MFNIGASELILILLIAFIVVGPQDLPKIARALGRLVRMARAMIAEVKREAGLDELEKEFKSVQREAEEGIRAADIRPELRKTRSELDKELRQTRRELKQEIDGIAKDMQEPPKDGGTRAGA